MRNSGSRLGREAVKLSLRGPVPYPVHPRLPRPCTDPHLYKSRSSAGTERDRLEHEPQPRRTSPGPTVQAGRGRDDGAPCNRHGDLDLARRCGTLAPGATTPLRCRTFRCGAASPADRGREVPDRHGRCGRRPTGTVSGIVLRPGPGVGGGGGLPVRQARWRGPAVAGMSSFGQFRDYRDRGEDLRPRHTPHSVNHPAPGNGPPNPTPVTDTTH